ncbi:GNAT family N-acetyltransferase [Streptomyces sp. NBC_01221]|uniref:GNAT family N-acetyltransferase n=1 Tax=Streptomyces sp. NBC_01221 TaxID=2903782 RepID=UPI00225BFABF|nr:GNAT family N-acetyltransferase [Streptomyces sp. NBC_01221]MCX4792649.1 GNAT family N-acetyltransferase [Streptomyces sp. NBC_01221]
MSYRIRPASPDDVPALMALRTEAETWLRQRGSDQWSDPEIGGRAITKWRETIDDGRAWVISSDTGYVVGTVSRGPADQDFWRNDDQLQTAFYLYKLIISRRAAGDGLGSLVLDWACRIAALEGRPWLRIDCWRTNRDLQRYYEGLGFSHVRTEAPAHRKSGWLAQRRSNSILNEKRSLVIDCDTPTYIPTGRISGG